MRNQIKFTFQIGYAKQNDAFEADIITAASRHCGGCTTSSKDGWWMDDGDAKKDTFRGHLFAEHCFELELTCEEHKAERAYFAVQQAICDAVLKHGVDTNWVHVTETPMTGRHFSVSALLAEREEVAA